MLCHTLYFVSFYFPLPAFVETCLLGEKAELVANITEKEESGVRKDHDRRGPSMHRPHTDPRIIIYKSQIDVFPEQSFSVVSEVS